MARQQKSGGSELREAKSETDRLRSEHERLHSDALARWVALRTTTRRTPTSLVVMTIA